MFRQEAKFHCSLLVVHIQNFILSKNKLVSWNWIQPQYPIFLCSVALDWIYAHMELAMYGEELPLSCAICIVSTNHMCSVYLGLAQSLHRITNSVQCCNCIFRPTTTHSWGGWGSEGGGRNSSNSKTVSSTDIHLRVTRWQNGQVCTNTYYVECYLILESSLPQQPPSDGYIILLWVQKLPTYSAFSE